MNSKNSKDLEIAYLLLRLTMGFNFLAHGIVRIPKLYSFSNWMTELFSESTVPLIIVKPFSLMLPFVELIIGILLILGLKTSKALHAGALVIVILVTGSCLIEKWDMAGGQMLYAVFFFLLSFAINLNKFSLDRAKFKFFKSK